MSVLLMTLVFGSVVGCQEKPSPAPTKPQGLVSSPPPPPQPVVDPKAFTASEFDRVRGGFAGINVGRMLIQRAHPTGSYIASEPPTLIVSADRRQIIGKVTVRWSGGVTGAQYETDFTMEVTKDRVRLTVERDLAVFHVEPNQLRLAEMDLLNILRPLL